MPISDPCAFWEEARWQRACAECGSLDQFEAHHTIEKQWLKRHGLLQYDTRGALRLCLLCHGCQTAKLKDGLPWSVSLKKLTMDNLEYAFEIMGAAAADYLHRHYEGDDPRLLAFEAVPTETDYDYAMRLARGAA